MCSAIAKASDVKLQIGEGDAARWGAKQFHIIAKHFATRNKNLHTKKEAAEPGLNPKRVNKVRIKMTGKKESKVFHCFQLPGFFCYLRPTSRKIAQSATSDQRPQ